MDFPGRLNNCETCHVAGTYSSVPLNALPATYEIGGRSLRRGHRRRDRNDGACQGRLVDDTNGTDRVTSPFAGACVSCHDSAATKSHIKLQGGKLQVNRNSGVAGSESCVTCHGPGRSEDPAVAHKR